MSDVYEVVVQEKPYEIVFNDAPVEVLITEDNFIVTVEDYPLDVIIADENIEVLTIAEQGPPGVGGGLPVTISNTPPPDPAIWDLWLDTN